MADLGTPDQVLTAKRLKLRRREAEVGVDRAWVRMEELQLEFEKAKYEWMTAIAAVEAISQEVEGLVGSMTGASRARLEQEEAIAGQLPLRMPVKSEVLKEKKE